LFLKGSTRGYVTGFEVNAGAVELIMESMPLQVTGVQCGLRAWELGLLLGLGRLVGVCDDEDTWACGVRNATNGCIISTSCCRATNNWALE